MLHLTATYCAPTVLHTCDIDVIKFCSKEIPFRLLPSVLFTSNSHYGSYTFAAALRLSCGEVHEGISHPPPHRRVILAPTGEINIADGAPNSSPNYSVKTLPLTVLRYDIELELEVAVGAQVEAEVGG